ncbi:MAG: hypothetical protein GF344_14200 [Chitinivibrionales bacterium]|nr:hypothetical protein [Chitinivibrionales bacterium]MBD3357879.1 hypothetical protein [Chitinivibrionales bacterium]
MGAPRKSKCAVPRLPAPLRKNDAFFMHGAIRTPPSVYAYAQDTVEVVHGPACNPEVEIRLKQCKRDGVRVVPRRGGGGTVVLSPGTVVIVVVGCRGKGEDVHALFSRIHAPIIATLNALLPTAVEERGLSDLAVDGRKILGSSLYLSRKPALFFYQASLMVNNDLALLDRYLEHPPREPDYRCGRSHRLFCTTLEELGVKCGAKEIAERLAREIRTF